MSKSTVFTAFLCAVLLTGTSANAAEGPSVSLKAQPGWVIFDPSVTSCCYRYGPSILINDDKSIDAWFASPGGPASDGTGEWDWIRHKSSKDGGKTWSDETVVLRPTVKSRDRISVCDPGVIKIGKFYYLGVTAVDNEPGVRNEIFVARSQSPTGPFEKWNGSGWGGSPQPLVAYDGPKESWGLGEPSFVVKGKTLHIYYTNSVSTEGHNDNQTMMATAPADDPNWPGKLKKLGVAWDRVEGEDSADVKWIPEYKTFLAISSAKRMGPNAYIAYRTSPDGFHWSAPGKLNVNISPWCHNAGISSRGDGHIELKDNNVIGYAFSRESKVNWAFWYTNLNPVVITKK